MDNSKILELLERQRDTLYDQLKNKTISGLYMEQYADIKAGRVFIFNNDERQMLTDLKNRSKDKSLDESFKIKLNEYLTLDNKSLIAYFQSEFERIFNEITGAEKQDYIQAIFTEYDYYYDYTSSMACYGLQEYPIIEEPRYTTNEYDYNKQILFIRQGINFQPAWVDCEEFGDLEFLNINYKLENLYRLHSRVLLHKALENLELSRRLNLFKNRPFSFYINEHDSEVMLYYRLN